MALIARAAMQIPDFRTVTMTTYYQFPGKQPAAERRSILEGIASGSGRNLDEILALNARTEILPPSYPGEPHPDQLRIAAANVKSGVPDWGECTSVAVKPGQSTTGTTLLAQNWDWLGAQRAGGSAAALAAQTVPRIAREQQCPDGAGPHPERQSAGCAAAARVARGCAANGKANRSAVNYDWPAVLPMVK